MKKLTVAVFLALASCAPLLAPAVQAQECKTLPFVAPGKTLETYTGPDVGKLPHAPGTDTIVIILNQKSGEGFVYMVKEGCVIAVYPADDSAVERLMKSLGIERKKVIA